MLIIMFLLLQGTSTPAFAPTTDAVQPCRLKGPRGKLIDVDPRICEQSTWDKARAQPLKAADGRSTTMELDVNQAGRVKRCSVVGSSGSPTLDAKACSIAVEKARYQPAIDSEGKPKRTTTRLKVSWPSP